MRRRPSCKTTTAFCFRLPECFASRSIVAIQLSLQGRSTFATGCFLRSESLEGMTRSRNRSFWFQFPGGMQPRYYPLSGNGSCLASLSIRTCGRHITNWTIRATLARQ